MPKPSDLGFNDDNPNIYLDGLEEFYDNDQLSGWEKAFYQNVKTLIETGEALSLTQFTKLKEIYEEYCS